MGLFYFYSFNGDFIEVFQIKIHFVDIYSSKCYNIYLNENNLEKVSEC
ncbi:hypothetical protein BD412_000415 [Thermoanaerobacterium thermosaccharolyticum]|nr:hypothetical protein [Thermoanaerobacterium thermosaccharolyticum]